MRIALLQLPDPAIAEVKLAGKRLSEYQVEFALAAGCERIIVIAPNASNAAFALQEIAEKGGARFQVIADSSTLLGMVHSEDQLLSLARNLLPLSSKGLQLLSDKPAILTLTDQSDPHAGHERIDRETFWAGALLMPGRLADRLSELPGDADVQSALLRIALQAGVARVPYRSDAEPNSHWLLVGEARELSEIDNSLFAHAGEGAIAPSELAAAVLTRKAGSRFIGSGVNPPRIAGVSLVLAALACLVGWFGFVEAGLVGLAMAWIAGKFASMLSKCVPAASDGRTADREELSGVVLDLALILLLMLGLYELYSRWGEVWHLPFITIGLLRMAAPETGSPATRLIGDRALWALIFAVLTYFWSLEFGLEVISALVLAAILFDLPKRLRITAN